MKINLKNLIIMLIQKIQIFIIMTSQQMREMIVSQFTINAISKGNQ
ncbi:unnamed protein product [Paramecium sonneborni]|uniref:Uncharacterized protein n=1 Tax=Paramecium sonneborni TaxID=65129 RepID=A0A8S1NRX2_9CILI|nr:unnamed protein product [Paramecium sonneborni]